MNNENAKLSSADVRHCQLITEVSRTAMAQRGRSDTLIETLEEDLAGLDLVIFEI